jgi:hypothetical protein
MICKIADLVVELPEAGGLSSRCGDYLYEGKTNPDITIDVRGYNIDRYPHTVSEELIAYLESGAQFHRQLHRFNGLYLHASAVEVDGKAYIFSGPCGMGKSTHTKLWQQLMGAAVCRFNDDKPTLRRLEDRWYAFGTPWCGKDGINVNKKVPLAGICFLQQGSENRIRRLESWEAVPKLLSRTIHRFNNPAKLDQMLKILEKLVQEIPVYELVNRPEPEAARLSYETMRRGAEEAEL